MQKVWILFLLVFLVFGVSAQEKKPRVVQLSGVIFAPDSSSVIPGVHVFLPKNGRGTTTNPYGFFSLPVLEGDSIVFSAVGFKRRHYIVPSHDSDRSLKIIVTLEEDVTFLSEVEIFPYPTEEMFKEAVLALEMPNQEQMDNMNAWLSQQYMRSGHRDLPASPNANHRYFMEMQMQAIQNRYQMPANNLLNPFAWSNFIKSLKK